MSRILSTLRALGVLALCLGGASAHAACTYNSGAGLWQCGSTEEAFDKAKVTTDSYVSSGFTFCGVFNTSANTYDGYVTKNIGGQCVTGNYSYTGRAVTTVNDCAARDPIESSVDVEGTACLGGCEYNYESMGQLCGDGAVGLCLKFVRYTPSGAQCGSNDETHNTSDPPPEQCASLGGGYSQCVGPPGQVCIDTPAGNRHCWPAGSTGESIAPSGNESGSAATAPNAPAPPATPPADGGSWQPAANASSSHTTGGTTNHYNTTIFNSTGGAGGGVGDGGGGDGGGGDGGGDSASGGSCATGWTCSGSPIECAILTETHQMRCSAEQTSEDNASDAAVLDGIAGEDDGNPADVFIPAGTDQLTDDAISFGNACPTLSVQTSVINWTAPPEFCEVVGWIYLLVVGAAYILALRIVFAG